MKSQVFKMAIACACGTFLTSSALAVTPAKLVHPGYWYEDEDVRAVLRKKSDSSGSFIAPALPFESSEMVKEIVIGAVGEAIAGKSALIPINFGNSHWTALAIKPTSDGKLKAIYNDSFGSPITGRANSALLADILKQIDPSIEIIDLQTHQQRDGSSCGAFTAENLATIAAIDVSNLSKEQLQQIISNINDAGSIRQSHFLLLQGIDAVTGNPTETLLVLTEENTSNIVANEQLTSKQLGSNLTTFRNVTHDRLANLNFARGAGFGGDYLSGFSSGDDTYDHGVWLKLLAGFENDKQSARFKSKTKMQAFVAGVDTRLDEDSTIGIAYSNITSKSKSHPSDKTQTPNKLGDSDIPNPSTITSDIGLLYGSYQLNDEFSVSGSASYGKASIKTKGSAAGVGQASNSKAKATLQSLSGSLSYDYYPCEYFLITPNAGIDYEQVDVKGHRLGNLTIAKNTQKTLSGSIGLGLTSYVDIKDITLIHQLHTNYSHPLWSKGSGYRLANNLNQQLVSKAPEKRKAIASVGTGLTFATDLIELSVGIDYYREAKSIGQVGYIKTRVNF